MIQLDLEGGGPYRLGETVTGELRWEPQKDTKYKSVKVRLAWATEGRGDNDGAVADIVELPAGETRGGESLRVPFSLTLPDGGPMSYDGTLVRIIWSVHAVVDEPWKLGDDEASRPILVGALPAQS